MNKLTLFGAGSLRRAITEIADNYAAERNMDVITRFGPSGLLREEIENGNLPDIFTSADMKHPEILKSLGLTRSTVMFIKNRLCVVTRQETDINTDNVLDRLLDPTIRISAPKPIADPCGDYVWMMFKKADRIQPGSFNNLDQKVDILKSGAYTKQSPTTVPTLSWIFSENRADAFIVYFSTAKEMTDDLPGLKIIELPSTLSVSPEFGMCVLKDSMVGSTDFALHILSPVGQEVFKNHGFLPISLPVLTNTQPE